LGENEWKGGIMNISPNDAVKLMICYSELELNGDFWIVPIDGIHTAIYDLKKEYPDFFHNIKFSNHTLEPYSNAIEATCSSLMASRCIFMDAPDFKRIFMKKEMKDALLEHLENEYSTEIQKLAQKIVNKFDKIIKKT
jgi:hypothetical protein